MKAGMDVRGEIYPPAQLNQFLSQVCMYMLFTMVAMMFIGDNLFKTLDFPLGSRMCRFLKENFSTTMILAFILNMAAQQLVQTGAFEIQIDDQLVFSKLETGRLPTMDLLNTWSTKYGVASE
ncbi:hypothetical protein AAMO2058_001339000 [Amorphochlora amoebiformis]|uniref:Selenoprotein T n=1 Tax=Amorphochlora amoebiformis TaxID=1561963 RepID=A0A7S0DPX7_9EUKA|mmetsp:Transcript_4094/g.6248  ORF Transcript_4094/g.6248 Transcript_4094/m.6248 type:complete len:122 (+) Transcript_4094:143-508(+)